MIMIHPTIRDVRSGKIIFLSHCCLNQNAKVRGIAIYPGCIRPMIELLIEKDVAIYQMPCPEMTYIGAMRWGHVKDQYDSPMFRRHCLNLATEVLDQAEEYKRSGYRVLGFVMMDGSPVCGLNKTPQPANEGEMWGGMVRYVPESTLAQDKGVYSEILMQELEQRPLLAGLPLVGFPESNEQQAVEIALNNIRSII
jgi:predicted secreted protein